MSDDEQSKPVQDPTPRWAEDFPVRWEADHYVSRRELAKFLTLGSGLLCAASVGIVAAGALRHEGPMPRARIAVASELAAGRSMLFRYPTDADPCILLRTHDGQLVAYSQVCTHLSCAVVYRAEPEQLFCPCHAGAFSCREGRPIAGPPTRPLPRILLEERDGDVFAVGVQV